MNRYIDGMKEIKAGEELKQRMIHNAQQQPLAGKKLAFKKTAPLLAAVCAVILIAMLGTSIFQPNDKKAMFASLVITAYAADGTAVEMKPNVELPLGTYSPFMSSVPGFPISIAAEDADSITVKATEGSFLLWTPPASKVIQKGKSVTISSGTIIYWSPPDDYAAMTLSKKSTVSIIAYQNKKELGRRSIDIQADDSLHYSGLVKEE
jgi:hypothetical protein